MIRLLARVYTQTDYQTSYRSLAKLVLDGWSVSSINWANEKRDEVRHELALARFSGQVSGGDYTDKNKTKRAKHLGISKWRLTTGEVME